MYKLYIVILIIIITIIISSVKKNYNEKFAFTKDEEDILKTFAQKNDLLSKIDEISTMDTTYLKKSEAYNTVDAKISALNIPENLESKLLSTDNISDINKSSVFFEGVDINNIENKYMNFSNQIYKIMPENIENTSNNLYDYLNKNVELLTSKITYVKEPESDDPSIQPQEISGSTDKYFKFLYIDDPDNLTGTTIYGLTFYDLTYCDILIVGGGGGGGNSANTIINKRGAGGGGAGGYIYKSSVVFTAGNYNITVGKGGSSAESGKNSSISANNEFMALGGGGGGSTYGDKNGKNGGSGGGGADPNGIGGISSRLNELNNGNNGGKSTNSIISFKYGGAGGGGASGVGEDSTNSNGGLGGEGILNNIIPENITYAVGGKGGDLNSTSANAVIDAIANTGNGGGGANGGGIGGKGGSGIVIIRFTSNKTNERISRNTISIDELNRSLAVLKYKQSELAKI